MKININQIIVSFLRRVGVVSLPGIGRFTLKRNASVFEENRSVLKASTYLLSYSDSAMLGDELIQEIASKNNLSVQIAKDRLLNYIDHLLNQLESKGEIYISNLGKIVAKNETRVFTQDENSIFSTINFGLPDISMSPIIRERAEKISLIEKLREQNENIPLAAPIIRKEAPTSYNYFGSLKDWLIAILMTCLILCLFNTYNSCNYKSTSTTPVVIDSISNEEIVNAIDSNQGTTLDSIINDNINSDRPIKCIIITGSFKRSRNAIRMQDQILSLGYEPYISRHNTFDRVGIIFNCKGLDLVEYISKIREEFNIESWYLEPQLVVAPKGES